MSSTPTKPNYAPFEANIDGAIAAANYLMSEQGYGIRDYPNNKGGLVAAILNLNIGQSNVGITPSQWMPVRDEDGNIVEDSWDPPPSNGTLWFDTRQGKLMVWLNDGFYQANGVGAYSSVGSSIPQDPIEGQTWLDTDNYVYYIYDGNLWHELASIQGGTGSGSSGGEVSSAAILDLQQQIDNISIDFTPEEITALQNQFTNLSNTTTTQLTSMQNTIDAIDKDGIDAKFSELEAQLAVHTTNITAVETTATDLSGRMSSAETGIISNTDAITAIETDLDTAEADITSLETALAAAVSNISTVEANLTTVETNLAVTSGKVTTNENNITLLSVDIDAVEADVATLNTTVGTIETDVASLTSTVGVVETGLASAKDDIETLQASVTTIEDDVVPVVTTNQTDIAALQTSLASLTTTVTTVQSDLAGVSSTVSTLDTDLTAAESAITTLTGNFGTVSSDVTALQTQVETLETLLNATAAELSALRTIYYGDSAPTDGDLQNGDLWVDSSELRLLVRHVGAWFNPDRSSNPDDSAETLIINAVNNSATFDEFKTFINANA